MCGWRAAPLQALLTSQPPAVSACTPRSARSLVEDPGHGESCPGLPHRQGQKRSHLFAQGLRFLGVSLQVSVPKKQNWIFDF